MGVVHQIKVEAEGQWKLSYQLNRCKSSLPC